MSNVAELPKFPAFPEYALPGDSVEVYVGPLTVRAKLVEDQETTIDDDDVHVRDRSHPAWDGATDLQYNLTMQARDAHEAGQWFYGGIILSVLVDNTVLDAHAASIWGLEVNYPSHLFTTGVDEDSLKVNEHLAEAADEMLEDAMRHCSLHLRTHLSRVRRAHDALKEVVEDEE